MHTPLDEVRDRPSQPGPAPRAPAGTGLAHPAPARLPDVVRAGRYPADELSARVRRFVAGTAVAAALVGITHGLLAGWLAHATGGPWSAARAVVDWPWPVAQQILAVVAAIALAAATGGYWRISRELSWPLLAATIAAALGAGPMVLVCAVTAAVWALIAAVVAVMVALVLMMLAA